MSSERTLSVISTSGLAMGPPGLTVAELHDASARTDEISKAMPIPRPTERDGPCLRTPTIFVPTLLQPPDPLGGINHRTSFLPSHHDRICCRRKYRRLLCETIFPNPIL